MVRISVIVPAYKRVDQTVRTLKLLQECDGRGTVFEAEFILADSTPDSSLKDAVAAAYGQSVLYVKPEKTGIAANKNAGARAAHNPVLIFSDSDIEPEKNTLSETVSCLQTHGKIAALGGTVLWRGGPHDGQKDRPRPEDRMLVQNDTTFVEAIYSRFMATYKDVFMAAGGYDETVFNMRGEGSDLSARYWRAGYPMAYDEKIVVHHVHDVPDAAAVRVEHPEWGIAKDLLLLAYKYGMDTGEHENFRATVGINFSHLGSEGYYLILEGIGRHFADISSAKQLLDAFRAQDKPVYPFPFLEVFSDTAQFAVCLDAAEARLSPVRTAAFAGAEQSAG